MLRIYRKNGRNKRICLQISLHTIITGDRKADV